MNINELKNERLIRQIIQTVLDSAKVDKRTYSLEHPSVNIEDYEQLFEMIRRFYHYESYIPKKYWVFFTDGYVYVSFEDSQKKTGDIEINPTTGTVGAY